jgi:hypothetical protein
MNSKGNLIKGVSKDFCLRCIEHTIFYFENYIKKKYQEQKTKNTPKNSNKTNDNSNKTNHDNIKIELEFLGVFLVFCS